MPRFVTEGCPASLVQSWWFESQYAEDRADTPSHIMEDCPVQIQRSSMVESNTRVARSLPRPRSMLRRGFLMEHDCSRGRNSMKFSLESPLAVRVFTARLLISAWLRLSWNCALAVRARVARILRCIELFQRSPLRDFLPFHVVIFTFSSRSNEKWCMALYGQVIITSKRRGMIYAVGFRLSVLN